MEMNYATNAKGNLGVTLGAVGLGAALLNNGAGGLLGGLTGGGYTRYDAEKDARIAQLEGDVKLRDANVYTDGKLNDLRNYMERRFDHVEHELCDQRVYNATNTGAITCIQGQIAQLMSLTKTIVPIANVCPQPMPQYNSWTAPTTTT